nr:PhzF family phenazine biosynthesis protein [Vibrio sonorensis]
MEGNSQNIAPQSLGVTETIVETFVTRDLVLVLPSPLAVARFVPDFDKIEATDGFHALIVTAKSSENSYVLRYFAPQIGIPEDLATGSAQCSLAPYWFNQLNKNRLSAQQMSATGGYFEVEKTSSSTITVSAAVKLRQSMDIG